MRETAFPGQADSLCNAGKGHDLIHARVALQGGRELGFDEDRDPAVGPVGFQALVNRPGQDDVTEAGKPYNEYFGRQRRLYHFARGALLADLGGEVRDELAKRGGVGTAAVGLSRATRGRLSVGQAFEST